MYSFSNASRARLNTCDPRLQRVFNRVIWHHDCTIIEGHRIRSRQLELYAAGRTKVKQGKHNATPSLAVDVAPYIAGIGIPWPNKKKRPDTYTKDFWQFVYFAGIVMGTAAELGVQLRWGGDWDRDRDMSDQSFDDLVHFELVDDQTTAV